MCYRPPCAFLLHLSAQTLRDWGLSLVSVVGRLRRALDEELWCLHIALCHAALTILICSLSSTYFSQHFGAIVRSSTAVFILKYFHFDGKWAILKEDLQVVRESVTSSRKKRQVLMLRPLIEWFIQDGSQRYLVFLDGESEEVANPLETYLSQLIPA